ncbi:uncharacterized protein LOC105190823 isoform X2 [Harpegnathos saltator]|uniref:uncharacterized protein LOC105190823 isoform X2 n=1 Tax=Harpegnathos saltator TaxID=610380 RepID=UPI000948A7E4|nr:uncharacterized protein LOC105190823 isoform X2 [Harpegnathos saltator]
MNFQNVNPLNARLNKLSGNLLPMTGDDLLFPTAWRIYSAVVWVVEVVQVSAIIPAVMYVSKEKILQDMTVGVVISVEAFFLFIRIHSRRNLVKRLIRQLNDILSVSDQTMESIVRSTVRPMQAPLKFYWIAGSLSVTVWCCMSFVPILKRNYFYYEDYRVPVAFSRQPFSMNVFLVGNLVVSVTSVYIFMRKVALDVYTINLILLMTAQYRYVAMRLATIFRKNISRNQREEFRKSYSDANTWLETEMRILCQHHNAIVHMTPLLKKLLSVNLSLIYLNNVFRFCFNGIMLMIAVSSAPLEALMIFTYMCGGLVQFYILCLCAHQLLDASIEVTDEAFHEKWYQFEPSLKHTFLSIIAANNLECKLAALEKFNLSLPSFMTVLNNSYSIALLFLRVR